jgi:hypothetical protein
MVKVHQPVKAFGLRLYIVARVILSSFLQMGVMVGLPFQTQNPDYLNLVEVVQLA